VDPITAFTVASTAFATVKKMVAAGREVQDVAGQIGKWFGAVTEFNRSVNVQANKKPSIFKRVLDQGSIEQQALEMTMGRQAIRKQEYVLKILIIAKYGENVYNEMMMDRIRLRKEQEKREREHAKRREDFRLNVLYGSAIAVMSAAVIWLTVFLFDYAQKK